MDIKDAQLVKQKPGRGSYQKQTLSVDYPQLAKEWHATKNGVAKLDDFTQGSDYKPWWKCPVAEDHEWQTSIANRVRGTNCPCCEGLKVSTTNSLASLHPSLSLEWHPTRNGKLTPADVVASSSIKAWWKCAEGPDHEYPARISHRTSSVMSGCPCCGNKKVSVTNSLAALHPEIARFWHPTKNAPTQPTDVVATSAKKVWWLCEKGHETHTQIRGRTTQGLGCRKCSGRNLISLSAYEELVRQWHPTKNAGLTPSGILASSKTKVWWKCDAGDDHEWENSPSHRKHRNRGCPYCIGKKVSKTNSLASLCPDVAAEFHPTKNGGLSSRDIVAGSQSKVWWLCPKCGFDYEAVVASRTQRGSGCQRCNVGWTINAIRSFVASLRQHLPTFTPAELYSIFLQSRLWDAVGKGSSFVKALATGRFPLEEIDKFLDLKPSAVDRFVESSEAETAPNFAGLDDVTKSLSATGFVPVAQDSTLEPLQYSALPLVQAKNVLESLNIAAVTSADAETIDFLLASAVNKLWKHAYQDEIAATRQIAGFAGSEYAEKVKNQFMHEFQAAKSFSLPTGYSFTANGKPANPNLMQLHFATLVAERKRVGNWSGTGAGKTLSAVLSTRLLTNTCTIICCPNSVVQGWCNSIRSIFPDSIIAARTFFPEWIAKPSGYRYLVLHYEAFQQPESSSKLRKLLESVNIDTIVIDEIHFAKQRYEDISLRRERVNEMVSIASRNNPHINVLGMSATPVINNLQEGRSMVELITGLAHDELATTPTLGNCMALHQRLVTLGIRWKPEYDLSYQQLEVPVDCTYVLDDIRALGKKGTPLALEQILTRVRLPVITKNIKQKTLIYTHHISGIDKILYDSLSSEGWRVGFFYGEDKSGLDGFLFGDIDILIATSAIATGVDGLQAVCNRLIINDLPWTAAEFEQLKGRLFRQGQRCDEVTMVIPLTYADIKGQRWSWCESKMQRLKFKKSIADAAVDGVVPEGHLRSPAQAYKDVMLWLERLDSGKVKELVRREIKVPDCSDVPTGAMRKYGDFSKINNNWNTCASKLTNERLNLKPEEWEHYHALYREHRRDWVQTPYLEMIEWYKKRSNADLIIGDFGCGEAKIAEALSAYHTIYSFDHVAINDDVTACDMAHSGLDDGVLDVAIFCLSLMGNNFEEYLREAHRTLKLDGLMHIIEATGRFSDRGPSSKDCMPWGSM